MASGFSWLTLSQAITALQGRLANNQFWNTQELQLYIFEALRTWSALTVFWTADFQFPLSASQTWYNMSTLSGSPRLRTLTDANLYVDMQNALLEPATGANAWAGTSQFSLSELQFALQHRRDDMIQRVGCNLTIIPNIPSVPGQIRTSFPDTVLEPRRARFLATLANTQGTASSGATVITVSDNTGIQAGQIVTGTGLAQGTYVLSISGFSVTISQPTTAALTGTAIQFNQPTTLTREDTQAFDFFEVGSEQNPSTPASWSIIAGPPLSMDSDVPPNTPGQYEVIVLQSGLPFAPPASTLLGVPDDWAWVLKWGALADLLGRESEATDRQRAAYCLQRYEDGIKVMQASNWLLKANVDNVPTDTPSLFDQDNFSPEWEQDPTVWPTIVTAGIDYLAAAPIGGGNAAGVTLVGNAPIPASLTSFVQVSRDVWDVILGYAQHISCFKRGGAEFESTKVLLDDFFSAAKNTNKRLQSMGLFANILQEQGKREDIELQRW